jgi:hypothetical protein
LWTDGPCDAILNAVGVGTSGQLVQSDGDGTYSLTTPSTSSDKVVVKSADENLASSTTLQDDNHLVHAVGTNETWATRFILKVGQTLTATGIKVAVTVPAGSSILVLASFIDSSGASRSGTANSSGGAIDFTTGVIAGNDGVVTIDVSTVTAGTSGNVQLQWAQSTSVGTQLTVYAGSQLTAMRA